MKYYAEYNKCFNVCFNVLRFKYIYCTECHAGNNLCLAIVSLHCDPQGRSPASRDLLKICLYATCIESFRSNTVEDLPLTGWPCPLNALHRSIAGVMGTALSAGTSRHHRRLHHGVSVECRPTDGATDHTQSHHVPVVMATLHNGGQFPVTSSPVAADCRSLSPPPSPARRTSSRQRQRASRTRSLRFLARLGLKRNKQQQEEEERTKTDDSGECNDDSLQVIVKYLHLVVHSRT